MNLELKEAIELLQDNCFQHEDCKNCPFYDKDSETECFLRSTHPTEYEDYIDFDCEDFID